jgi:hypothetical protein
MPVPLIAAVPLAIVAAPPLAARCAPGSREFLNRCPFTETADEGTDGLRRLTTLFEILLSGFESIGSSRGTLPGSAIRGLFAVGFFTGRA